MRNPLVNPHTFVILFINLHRRHLPYHRYMTLTHRHRLCWTDEFLTRPPFTLIVLEVHVLLDIILLQAGSHVVHLTCLMFVRPLRSFFLLRSRRK